MSGIHSLSRAAIACLLLAVLSPLIIVVLLLWVIATISLYISVWLLWCTRGKDILFVYSDSPVWRDYIENHIIPDIEARSVILNWSERRFWLRKFSLASLLFRHFGGYREYNPVAIYFQPFWRHRSFRFWKPFRDWKHDRPASLQQVEDDFFRSIGQVRLSKEIE